MRCYCGYEASITTAHDLHVFLAPNLPMLAAPVFLPTVHRCQGVIGVGDPVKKMSCRVLLFLLLNNCAVLIREACLMTLARCLECCFVRVYNCPPVTRPWDLCSDEVCFVFISLDLFFKRGER